jgi:hypothetical protein
LDFMGPIVIPETSVRSHHYALRNNPKERRFHLLVDTSLKSSITRRCLNSVDINFLQLLTYFYSYKILRDASRDNSAMKPKTYVSYRPNRTFAIILRVEFENIQNYFASLYVHIRVFEPNKCTPI